MSEVHCLPVNEWPATDQAALAAAHRQGGLLDDSGLAAGWAPDTSKKVSAGYGRWLWFLIQTGQLDASCGPAERISRDRVLAYVDQLRQRHASGTVFGRVLELSRAIGVMAPSFDRTLLIGLQSRLRAAWRPARDDRTRLLPAKALFEFAQKLMQRGAAGQIDRSPWRQSVAFRDGLAIAVLCICAVRAKNFAGIRLGSNLVSTGDAWWLHFASHETKNKRRVDMPLPMIYSAWIERYLTHHRQRLMSRPPGQVDWADGPLWLTHEGQAIRPGKLNDHIKAVTERALGKAINLHLFRKVIPTELAIHDPRHAGIAQPMLAHSTYRMTQQTYNLGRAIDAARKVHALVGTRRQDKVR